MAHYQVCTNMFCWVDLMQYIFINFCSNNHFHHTATEIAAINFMKKKHYTSYNNTKDIAYEMQILCTCSCRLMKSIKKILFSQFDKIQLRYELTASKSILRVLKSISHDFFWLYKWLNFNLKAKEQSWNFFIIKKSILYIF